jgi:hypothetical protein
MDARPGGPVAKREPSPEEDLSAVGAALNQGQLPPVSLGEADSRRRVGSGITSALNRQLRLGAPFQPGFGLSGIPLHSTRLFCHYAQSRGTRGFIFSVVYRPNEVVR